MRYLITLTMGTEKDRYNTLLDVDTYREGMNAIREKLSRIGGGYTERLTSGGWENLGEVITELGRQFEMLTDEIDSLMEVDKLARSLASYAASALNQASVMYTFTPVTAGFVGPNEA